MERFERLGAAIGTSQEVHILDEIYDDMPAYNLVPELLLRVPDRTAMIEVGGVLWSDWSKPERITHTLRRIGRQPAFPLGCLHQPFLPNPQVICEAGAPVSL